MATAKIYFDTRRAKKDNTYPIKIRITHERKAVFFPTKYSMSENDFAKVASGFRLSEVHKKIKAKLDALILKADTIIEDLTPFSFDAFELRFTSKGDRADLLFLLTDRAVQLRAEGKPANANLYQQSAELLKKYHADKTSDPKLLISSVTPKWLLDFEKWAVSKGYSLTTIGMYLVRVRAIFNSAIEAGELKRSSYPFGKSRYPLPSGSNNKRALILPEIMQIYKFSSNNPGEQFARDIFIFSYLSNGMNTYDIWRLKWSDIQGNQFSFIRKKTETKTRGQNRITVILNEDLWDVINRQGSRKIGNDYVFNVLKPGMAAKEEMSAVKRMTTFLNTYLKRIAEKVGITGSISTYFARHSFATILMNSEAPLAFISKQLGHADIKTTQNYLDSFTNEKIAEYQASLLDKEAV